MANAIKNAVASVLLAIVRRSTFLMIDRTGCLRVLRGIPGRYR